eukprot:139459-Prymnesium_polylepis.1
MTQAVGAARTEGANVRTASKDAFAWRDRVQSMRGGLPFRPLPPHAVDPAVPGAREPQTLVVLAVAYAADTASLARRRRSQADERVPELPRAAEGVQGAQRGAAAIRGGT